MKAALPAPAPPQVRQVWAASKENMCRKLGRGTGLNLWNFAHGLDDRPVETPKASACAPRGVGCTAGSAGNNP